LKQNKYAGTQDHHDPVLDPGQELVDFVQKAPRKLTLGLGGMVNIVCACGMNVTYRWLKVASGIVS